MNLYPVGLRLTTHRRIAAVALLLTVITPFSLRAQGAAPVDAATLARYDTNHNGQLDPDEVSAMQADQARAAPAAAPSPTQTTATPAASGNDTLVLSPFQ